MSTPPLVDLPASACFASASLTLNHVVGSTVSPFTLEDQSFKWPGEAWTISVTMPPFRNRGMAAEWQSFGLKLKGSYGRFLIGDPLGKYPRGVATGSPVVDGNGQEGGALSTSGWTAGVAGIMLKGDYIQIGEGVNAKLHMLVEDANSDSSGDAVLVIAPDLRGSPTSGTAITTENACGLFKLTSNSWTWNERRGGVYEMSFSAGEVVNA